MTAIPLETAGRLRALPVRRAGELASRSDEELMDRLRSGAEDAAFEELVRRHSDRAYQVALAFLTRPEAAEDAVQECFLHLVRARRTYRRGRRFAPWFYTLLRNACRDELRRRPHRPRTGADLPEPPLEADPCAELAAREDWRAACRAFAELPEADREILALRIGGGLEFAEVARMTDVSPECAKKRAYRSLEKLRRALADRS